MPAASAPVSGTPTHHHHKVKEFIINVINNPSKRVNLRHIVNQVAPSGISIPEK